jgi:PAS domain S-box-containing protein
MHRQVRVLHVDDDGEFTEMAGTLLEREDDDFTVETAASASEGLARLAETAFDCVVSDYDMPETNGIEFLEAVRAAYPELPFVLYTGKGSEEIASDAISSGVTDYLQKSGGTNQYTVLANRISNAVEAYRAASDLERKGRQDEAIAELGRSALEGMDPQALFDRAVELVPDRLGTEYADVLRLSPTDDHFEVAAGSEWDDAPDGAMADTDTKSQAGYTLSVSEPVVVEDLREEDRFTAIQPRRTTDVVSCISVVIGSSDDPWGVFATHSTEPTGFTENDVTFVQNVANLLGSAIQRNRSEQRRRESERRFREIAEVSPDTIFRLDTDGVFTFVSPVIESLLGYSPAELLGTNFQTYVPDESMETAVSGFSQVATGETVRELELMLIDAAGDPVDVEVSASPVTHDGSVRFIQGLVRDLTERKERERDLRRYREYTDDMLDAIEDVLFVHDRSGDLQRWNESFAAVTGYDDDELAAMNGTDFVPAADQERTAAAIDEVFETGRARVQAGLLTEDGTEIPYEYVGNRIVSPDGTPLLVGIGRDISERMKRERELQRLKAQYEALVGNIPDMGVALFDQDCRYTVAGGEELTAFGLTPADFEGATPHDLFPTAIADELEHNYREALEGRANRFEQQYQDKRYQIRTVPVRDDDGDIISGLAVSEDITDRRERQRTLERQNERLREFASVVSHDLRNPLNVAQGHLELARADCDSDHLNDMAAALERSHALIDDLLTLARSGDEVTETESLDLATVAERCWQNVPTEDATLAARTTRTIVADRGRLEQLLENLVGNAVEHGPPGPETQADTSERDTGELTVTIGSLEDGFYVEDSGTGIPPGEHDDIFEAGYSTADDGTGFGLRIVKQIADAHGWTVTATDGESGGARFEIRGAAPA